MTISPRRIAILAEGSFSLLDAKTASGVIRYSPHETVAVIDSTKAGRTVQDVLGFGGAIPVVSGIAEALERKPEVLLIGIAPMGGQFPSTWRKIITYALDSGLEIWNGLHAFMSDDEEFSRHAAAAGTRIWDVRKPPANLSCGEARALKARAFIVLAIGSDCNVGKMTTCLELQKCARERGYKAAFVATGQTGILIAGDGTPLDAIPGDFMSGEVERLVMQCDAEGADVIFVEGQGAVLHPGFGAVTLGLLLGAMPDSFVLVHQPTRTNHRPDCDVEIPPLSHVIDVYEHLMTWYKAPKVAAIALNTHDLSSNDSQRAVEDVKQSTGLPVTDPVRAGVEPIFAALEPLIKLKRGL
jgi:uncharacterized NAD-dependent epimerase/dehydratase family protein